MTTERADDGWPPRSAASLDPDGDLDFGHPSQDPGSRLWMLWLAAASVGASLAMFALGEGLVPNILGYILGSVVAFTLVALFSRAARVRLFTAGIGTARALNNATVALLAVGLLSVALHAYLIARHYS
jgi:hypothetical protein